MRFNVLTATSTFYTFPIYNWEGIPNIRLSTNKSQPQTGAAVCLVEIDLPFESIYFLQYSTLEISYDQKYSFSSCFSWWACRHITGIWSLLYTTATVLLLWRCLHLRDLPV